MPSPFPYDVSVLIGRFQPFHVGHAALLAKALECAPKVAVVLGSSFRARSAKNPFTWEERSGMIASALSVEERDRLRFLPLRDAYDDLLWAESVKHLLESVCLPGERVALVGHAKDSSSDYLGLFPELDFVDAGYQGDVNATALRKLLFEKGNRADLSDFVDPQVAQSLAKWIGSREYSALRDEYLAVQESRSKWGTGPFITLDALVCARQHVLLVRRGHSPGKGLWAIPGGFLEYHERLIKGAKRELLEETGLDLEDPGLMASLLDSKVFDHPARSQRGRIITHVYHFELGLDHLPPVLGSDDAAAAQWIPRQALPGMEELFFEDHFHILRQFGLCDGRV